MKRATVSSWVLFQKRNAVDRRWLRNRSQKCIYVGQLRIGKNFFGVRRHLAAWLSNIFRQGSKGHWPRGQPRSDATLSGITVALITPELSVQFLAVFHISRRRGVLR